MSTITSALLWEAYCNHLSDDGFGRCDCDANHREHYAVERGITATTEYTRWKLVCERIRNEDATRGLQLGINTNPGSGSATAEAS